MHDYVQKLTQRALTNNDFRQVIDTGNNMQVVIMSLNPHEDIGMEVHEDNEQLLICLEGRGKLVIDDTEASFEAGDMALVRAGLRHNFVNGSDGSMKIITVYSPPHHPDGTIHHSKADASD